MPDREQVVGRLGDLLGEYPDRPVLIEVFSASRASESADLTVSERQGTALRDALIAAGAQSDRVNFCGYGEGFGQASSGLGDQDVMITVAGRDRDRVRNLAEIAGEPARGERELVCSNWP